MYLTKLVLDPMDRLTMRTVSDAYRLHKFVMAGFAKYDKPSRVLYRLEPEARERALHLLVQSCQKPNWNNADEYQKFILELKTKDFNPQFRAGAQYRFRFRANPVVTRDGKRHGLIRDAALINWLRKKEVQAGATFSSVLVIDEGYITGQKRNVARIDLVKIKTVRFEGQLKITDPTLFGKTFLAGIGPAKAFGCGMLSLARA
jgi:CRISPR system Cascade subunit CasE